MSAHGIVYGWKANPRDTRVPGRATLHVEVPAGHAAVSILGADGKALQKKVGALSEDGTRCRIRYEGQWVDATKQGNRWVYRPPVEVSDDA